MSSSLIFTNASWILSSSKLFQGEGYFNKLKLYAYDFFPQSKSAVSEFYQKEVTQF